MVSILTSVDLFKVQFLDVQESYGLVEPVTFRYKFTTDFIPNSKDWIGIYRVGWKSIRDYVAREGINFPSNHESEKQSEEFVYTFSDDNRPKNDEDFFQFCYIDSEGRVCGVSSPFQFLEDYDIVIVDETDSMLLVPSSTSLAPDEIEVVFKRPQLDEVSNEKVEELTRELEETRHQLNEKDQALNEMSLKVDAISGKLKDSEDLSGHLTEEVDRLKSKLLCEMEKLVVAEQSLSEREQSHQKELLKLNEKDGSCTEKEKQLGKIIQDLKNQLCLKAQELEITKLDHSTAKREHATVVDILDVKQNTVEELQKRCKKLSSDMILMKKQNDSMAKLEVEWLNKEKEYIDQIRFLEVTLKDEKLKSEKRNEESLTRVESEEIVIDGQEAIDNALTAHEDVTQTDAFGDNAAASDAAHGSRGIPDENAPFVCDSCGLSFPPNTHRDVIRAHVKVHIPNVCPICSRLFDSTVTQEAFEMHVSEHLSETIRQHDGRKICPMCSLEFPTFMSQHEFEIHVNGHFIDNL